MATNRDKEIRAADAQQVLDNPAFQESFDAIREDLVQAIEENNLSDDIYRDKLMMSLQLLQRVKRQLTTFAAEQKIAENNRRRGWGNVKGL